ncbi:MAG: hypothetical protein QOJ89_3483 [bacterium]
MLRLVRRTRLRACLPRPCSRAARRARAAIVESIGRRPRAAGALDGVTVKPETRSPQIVSGSHSALGTRSALRRPARRHTVWGAPHIVAALARPAVHGQRCVRRRAGAYLVAEPSGRVNCRMYANRRRANPQACRQDAIGQRSGRVLRQRSRCCRSVARGNAARVPERQPPRRRRRPRRRVRRNRARSLATTAHTLRDRRGRARRGGTSAQPAPGWHLDDPHHRIPR